MNLAPHPRLLLDAPTLVRVKSADLSALRAACDPYLSGKVYGSTGNQYPDAPDLGSGYEGESYPPAVLNFALLYQCTGDARYGNKAV